MIDQSNRAGKLNIDGSEDLDGQNLLCVSTSICVPTIARRHNHSKRTRGLPQNQKKLHYRTKSTKMSAAAPPPLPADVSRRSPLSYMTKGKSI
jgi:hypothetical protein